MLSPSLEPLERALAMALKIEDVLIRAVLLDTTPTVVAGRLTDADLSTAFTTNAEVQIIVEKVPALLIRSTIQFFIADVCIILLYLSYTRTVHSI